MREITSFAFLFPCFAQLGCAGGDAPLRAPQAPSARGDAGNDDELRREAADRFGGLAAVPPSRSADSDVTLGQALFWDTRLSGDGKTACASCHLPADGGADRRRFSPDAKGRNTSRNSQTVFNAVLQPSLRWTGDRKSGAHQAEKSLTGTMGFASADAVVPLLEKHGYAGAFRAAFPKDPAPMTPANYAAAIQAYESTLVTPAPFDRWLSGDDAALTAKQKAGLRLFVGKGCADCHDGALLGGTSVRKFGVAKDYRTATRSETKDTGLFESTKKEADRHVIRVSMLRNISKTAPYFHDGSVADLGEAVQVMAEVQLGRRLTPEEVSAIVAFLDSLSGEHRRTTVRRRARRTRHCRSADARAARLDESTVSLATRPRTNLPAAADSDGPRGSDD